MVSYFLALFIPVLLLVLTISYAIYQMDSKAELELLAQKNRNVVELQKEMIASDFDMVVSDLLYLAEDVELKEALGGIDTENWVLISKNLQHFANTKRIYDQIRFIDLTGHERIRINFDTGGASVVSSENLQIKKDRYYFTDSIHLAKGEIYVSPFDLNIERGQVEQPIKPMIRFATTVFDFEGNKAGILIFNYLGQTLITHFTRAHMDRPDLSHLLNGDGYWLHGNRPEHEWGFMFTDRKTNSFANSFSNEWQQIQAKKKWPF